MQDDGTAISIEGHAERPAADMRVDRAFAIVRCEEADDFAPARAAIDIVVRVENDVFRTVDFAKADDLDVANRRPVCDVV
jgi:hypothetical protein